jgi:hypothetical protein
MSTAPKGRNKFRRAHTSNSLSPRWGLLYIYFLPTAYAVGCILAPLRG